jgi:hypothetical protein
MTLSYSGLRTYGKIGLPSINNWENSHNIYKDPPRSIHTRKIDKITNTNELINIIDNSNDRFCENILYYARGKNPMVSVSYGESQGGIKLPYRIIRDGAFRAPIWRQEDLLPLSRLSRNVTDINLPKSYTNAKYNRNISNLKDYTIQNKRNIAINNNKTATYNKENIINKNFTKTKTPVQFSNLELSKVSNNINNFNLTREFNKNKNNYVKQQLNYPFSINKNGISKNLQVDYNYTLPFKPVSYTRAKGYIPRYSLRE